MSIDRMSLSLFREAIMNTGMVNEYFPHTKLTEIFERVTDAKHADTKIELQDLKPTTSWRPWSTWRGEVQPGLPDLGLL